jgi:hypothetical protein
MTTLAKFNSHQRARKQAAAIHSGGIDPLRLISIPSRLDKIDQLLYIVTPMKKNVPEKPPGLAGRNFSLPIL